MSENSCGSRGKICGILENCKNHPFITLIIPLIIFLLAFIPRITGLGTGLTTDENFWLQRAPSFINALIRGDFIHTYQSIHPGVMTMWFSGIFMKLFSQPGMDFPQFLSIARFPIALFTSLGILLMYFLLKELFDQHIAILASVLIALDPFYLAHSRVIHLDALVTTFMTLSLLTFMIYVRWPKKTFFLFFTGIFLGLALLTKQPAECLIPFFLLALIIVYLITLYQDTTYNLKKIITGCFSSDFFTRIVKPFVIILFFAGLLFVLLWPAMWVAPLDTVQKLGAGLENVVDNPHELNGFFMGQVTTTDNLGPWFYPVVILMKLTPLTLIFSVFCILFTLFSLRNSKFSEMNLTIILFVLFILFFYILMTISGKKFDRYILPVFPIIDIMAALGICFLTALIFERLDKIRNNLPRADIASFKNCCFGLVIILIIILQAALLIPITPYYLSYSNPVVFGGPQHAQEYILIGWGEGQDLAAAYLNNKTDAEHLKVFVQYAGFNKYFKGKTTNQSTSADYIVFYSCAVQRHFNENLWNQYKNKTAEKVIVLNNIEYCWIFPAQKE
jgi:4-amino-4-deoxy-L-arabinose transferase-like glycosyltransferase